MTGHVTYYKLGDYDSSGDPYEPDYEVDENGFILTDYIDLSEVIDMTANEIQSWLNIPDGEVAQKLYDDVQHFISEGKSLASLCFVVQFNAITGDTPYAYKIDVYNEYTRIEVSYEMASPELI